MRGTEYASIPSPMQGQDSRSLGVIFLLVPETFQMGEKPWIDQYTTEAMKTMKQGHLGRWPAHGRGMLATLSPSGNTFILTSLGNRSASHSSGTPHKFCVVRPTTPYVVPGKVAGPLHKTLVKPRTPESAIAMLG